MSKKHAAFQIRLLAAIAFLAAAAAACVGGASIAPSLAPATATPTLTTSPSPTIDQGGILETIGPLHPSQTAPGILPPTASATHVAEPPAAPLSTASLSEADNGKSIRVTAGANVELVLHNIYWHVAGSSEPSVLKAVGSPVYSGAGTLRCIPGTGCGTVTATFQAVAAGTARISATRTTCGEALQCVGDDGSFAVTLVVVP